MIITIKDTDTTLDLSKPSSIKILLRIAFQKNPDILKAITAFALEKTLEVNYYQPQNDDQ